MNAEQKKPISVAREVEFSKGKISNILYFVGWEGDMSEPMAYNEISALYDLLGAIVNRDKGMQFAPRNLSGVLLYETNISRADGTTHIEREAWINHDLNSGLTRAEFERLKSL